MNPSKGLSFTKMHGIGNDFIIIDNLSQRFNSEQLRHLSKTLCHRHYGVGSDGLIILEPSSITNFQMRMFNPDGSESEACGNGTRCFARYLIEKKHIASTLFSVQTTKNILEIEIQKNEHITVNMGKPMFTRKEIGITGDPDSMFFEETIMIQDVELKGTAVSMGNPHLVIFTDHVEEIPLPKWGPILENHPLFLNRTNVHFVQLIDQTNLIQRTWERGAGITLACGSGACAVAVAAHHTKNTDQKVNIKLPGGNLQINYFAHKEVKMTGPTETVFQGFWNFPV